MDAILSYHACIRLKLRTSMQYMELNTILDKNLCVTIGEETNNDKIHRLFYSKKDKCCFVAIQDTKTGTVITILPLDYHENISGAVSSDDQLQAKKRIIKVSKKVKNPKKASPPQPSPSFRISCNLVDKYGSYIKIISLGSWPSKPYKYNIYTLIEDEEFVGALMSKIRKKLTNTHSENKIWFIQALRIKLGQNGESVSLLPDIISIRNDASTS